MKKDHEKHKGSGNHSSKRQKAERRGRTAEMLAVLLLKVKGYRILAQRFRCKSGEIDIVAAKADLFVFVEVKARENTSTALESISQKQQRRIEAAAEVWLQTETSQNFAVRFDVITVAPRALPTHIMDAWRPGW